MTLKDRLDAGEVCVGPFLKLSDPAVVEIMALAAFDHVVIDLEHGPLSVETAQNLVRAARLRGIAPMIRVARNEPSPILRALDIGAEGVHVPHVSSVEDARRAVEACYFHPQGSRGVCRFVRAADYSACGAQDHFAESNRRTLPVLHVEGRAGIESLPEILSVPGTGVIFLGPYDLSQSLGVTGEIRHPAVEERMRKAVTLARDKNVVVGTFVESVEDAKRWAAAGVQYICFSVDVGILSAASVELSTQLRREVAEACRKKTSLSSVRRG